MSVLILWLQCLTRLNFLSGIGVYLVFACLSVASPVNATVMFNWVQTNIPVGAPAVGQIRLSGGSIVLSDAAVDSGTVSINCAFRAGMNNCPTFPLANVLSVSFWANTPSGGAYANAAGLPPPYDLTFGPYGSFNLAATLSVLERSRLSGVILVSTDEATLQMASDNSGLWTVSRFLSDSPSTNCRQNTCSGATGYWERAVVPTPSTIFLVSLMLFGLVTPSRFKDAAPA